MIEGQEGVSWAQWMALARAAEAGGFDALMRSDHFLAVSPARRDPGALDAWGTINAGVALAARLAHEYNVIGRDPAGAAAARAALDATCLGVGRDPSTLALSLVTPVAIGSTEAEARARFEAIVRQLALEGPAEHDRRAWLVGTPSVILERLREYAAAGVSRVMVQHLLADDSAALELLAREVVPVIATH
jgi:alkanesulfonate monooxygenase SsuD/methylene tetrahydromethanopterin reductase-like flavin-dependent oxidoreductase (luciferase family)